MVNPNFVRDRLHLDLPLLSGVLLLCGLGLVVLYSASGSNGDMVIRQAIRIAIGLGFMVGLAQIPPRQLSRWSPWLYLLGLLLLLVVMLVGDLGKGAQRWLDLGILRFQPSEMMKIVVPLCAAAYLNEKALPPRFLHVLLAAALFVLPAILIARQPDLGTALLIAASGVFVLFLAGMRWRLILAALLIVLISTPVLWMMMHGYQRQRVLTLLDPSSDPLGAGYHIIQSMIAVGSGGIYGKGWLNGTQSHLEFLPERSTDFIFAVLCEEFGFIGALLLFCGYAFLVLRGLYIAVEAQDTFARLLAGSLTLTFFFYIFVNTGMVIGELPVVGVPLPLVSYGGTSLVTLMAGFGILMAVHTHRRLLST